MASKADELAELQAQARELGIETHTRAYKEVGLLDIPLDQAGEFFMGKYGTLPNPRLVIEQDFSSYDGGLEARVYYDLPRSAADLEKEIKTELRRLKKNEQVKAKQAEKVREAELRELARLKEKYEGETNV